MCERGLKKWLRVNREKQRESERAWRLRNIERERARTNLRYQQDPRILERIKRWQRSNPNACARIRMNRRARQVKAFVETVDPRVVFDRDHGVCGICNLPVLPGQKWHVDHRIPLVRGGEHSYANTQLAHARCNLSKGSKVA